MSKKPLILVTNDDGITAPGIRTLISVMNEIGDVVVVAPDSPQSAMGHAITINSTLHCIPVKIDNGPQQEYSCSGTPADCIKLGINEILDRKPDICVSGINHGSNSSINVIYSGTMSAAIEASIEGIPSIGFSKGKEEQRVSICGLCQRMHQTNSTISVSSTQSCSARSLLWTKQHCYVWQGRHLRLSFWERLLE